MMEGVYTSRISTVVNNKDRVKRSMCFVFSFTLTDLKTENFEVWA